jgi:hypothetical protein
MEFFYYYLCFRVIFWKIQWKVGVVSMRLAGNRIRKMFETGNRTLQQACCIGGAAHRLVRGLYKRLTDCGKVVTLEPAALYPQEDSWFNFS